MPKNIAHNLEEKPRTNDILIKESFNFNSLLLSSTTLQGLRESGFYKPSPIQLKAIPLGRCGLDLIVQAKSGTGKTAVFTIIALEMVNTTKNALQVLIFAPTREIAIQIEDVIKGIGKTVPDLVVASFIGGLPIEEDFKKLKKCHIAVGAPGRLKHLVEASRLKTDSVRLLVLDEADKLMEHCFQSDINYIYRNLPERKQVIALSATYPDKLDKFLENYMQSPTFVTPEVENPILLGLKQFVTIVKSHLNVTRQISIKNEELIRLLSKISFTQCLVFFNSQSRAEGISHTLNKDGWNTTYISAAQSQAKRIQAVNSLKKFECKILLSTDLTARGIDAANVNLVINYDVPFETSTYLHRMGRAGRYGSHGLCITIAANGNELKKFQNIIGEIGGSDLGIAKLPLNDEDVWECDLNSCEKIYGTIIDDNNINKSVDLQNSIFELKNKAKNSDLETDLERLSVDENCHSNSQIENIKNLLNNKQKGQEEISQKCSEIDTETLLQSLASGKDILPIKLNEETSAQASEPDTESLLKLLGEGKSIPKSNEVNLLQGLTSDKDILLPKLNEAEAKAQASEVDTEYLLKLLAAGEPIPAIKEINLTSMMEATDNHSVNNEIIDPDIIDPASLYPWVPVEGSPVLLDTHKGENLLDDSEEAEESSDNKKRKRKQYKKSNSNHQERKNEKSLVLLKNLALYSITQLLTNQVSQEDFNLIVNRLQDYLNLLKEKQKEVMNKMLKNFEKSTCNDLLENIALHSKKWSEFKAQEPREEEEEEDEDPEENIFKLGYFYMNKNKRHWIDALGDKYEPPVDEEESDTDEDMEYVEEEEEEFDFEEENATNYNNYYTTESNNYNYYNYNNLESMPTINNQQSNLVGANTSLEYPFNPVYASYFDYYKEMFENDAPNFEDIPSFNNYLSQWQLQVQSVRDYVQQNVYLQEMNNYQYQRGQFYNYEQNNQ